MPNHFATLDLPARPWIEPDAVKEAFHRIGAARHPDQPGGDASAFAAANGAWQVLRDPARRLRHLLELEGVPVCGTQIPGTLGETFMRIAALREKVDAFLRGRTAASGGLAKALLADERGALNDDVSAALARMEDCTERALDEVRAIDAAWPTQAPAKLSRLGELQQTLAFAGKWSDQLREALYRLST